MDKKFFIVIAIVLLFVIGGVAYLKLNQENIERWSILRIDTDLEMTEVQKETFETHKTTLESDINNYSARFNIARLKQDLLDYDGAEKMYLQLGKENPEDVLILQNLGSLYYDTKQYQKSETAYLNILEITPKWLGSYQSLYEIYQFHLPEKRPSFEKVLMKGIEDYEEMRVNLYSITATYYDELMDNPEKAIEYYKKTLEEAPDSQYAKDRLKELQ